MNSGPKGSGTGEEGSRSAERVLNQIVLGTIKSAASRHLIERMGGQERDVSQVWSGRAEPPTTGHPSLSGPERPPDVLNSRRVLGGFCVRE